MNPLPHINSFHSISFPSEWGVCKRHRHTESPWHVSIQLVSPTSGESSILNLIQRKMSRGHLRGSDLFLGFHTCVRSKKIHKTLAQ